MLRNKKRFMVLVASAALAYNTHTVKAEGSRELVNNYNQTTKQYTSNGGYRPYLWASDATTAGITRRTTFKVYTKAGETLNFGSSVVKTDSIMVKKPGDATWTNYAVSSSGTKQGYIDTVAKERIGPNTGGYTPITISVGAGQTGIWEFQFTGTTATGNPTFQKGSVEFINEQTNTIAAWDITVKDSSGKEIPGRLYSPYIAMIMGNNSATNSNATSSSNAERVLNNDFYVLTKDGYVYQTSMNGIDPNGFIFWSNNRGFVDKTNNKTLYHSIDGGNDTVDGATVASGNLGAQLPTAPDSETDKTHNVFINTPSSDLPAELSPIAVAPGTPQNFGFKGNSNIDLKTKVTEGGTFTFTADKASTYRLIIDTDGTNGYNLASDTVIENVCKAGLNSIVWNGKDKNGNTLPVGTYSAQIIMKGGEYHFPMLDAEYNPFGIKVKLINAPGYSDPETYTDKYKVYYDESNYTTANGTSVTLDAGNSTYNINPVSGLIGVDSSNGVHAYYKYYGNGKGIDTWTYFPGNTVEITLDVTPASSNINKSGTEDVDIMFTSADFTSKFSDGASNSLNKVKIISLPAYGTLKLNGIEVNAGQEILVAELSKLTFTPDGNWNGSTSFSWNGSNGTYYSANDAVVNITIGAVNDAPTVPNYSVATRYNQSTSGKVEASDVDKDNLTYFLKTAARNGVAEVDSSGVWTYVPKLNYSGTDSFTVQVSDGHGGTAISTVTITVNEAPKAQNDTASIDEDTSIDITVLNNDSDAFNDVFTIVSVSNPANGTVKVNPDKTIKYTPNANFNGTDSFTYTISDGYSATATATVNITVNAVNDAPTVSGTSITATEDVKYSSKLPQAYDADGNPLTYSVVEGPKNGELTLDALGNYTYTPDPDYNGPDSFTFKVNDGSLDSEVVTVNIVVGAVNDAPLVSDINKIGLEDTDIVFSSEDFVSKFMDIDSNSLVKIKIVTLPENGTMNLDGKEIKAGEELLESQLSKVTFSPNTNWNGNTNFEWNGFDGTDYAVINGVVKITVTPVNDAPVVVNETATTEEDKSVNINVLSNDSDVDSDSLTVASATKPEHGTIVVNTDGTITYTPDVNYNGADSFTYTVSDGKGGATTATVNINVIAVNDAPAVSGTSIATSEDTEYTGKLPTATDLDGNPLTYIVVETPKHGKLTLEPNGNYTYTPDPNYNGLDSFTFKVNDGSLDSEVVTLNITVTPVNDAPTVSNINKSGTEDTVITFASEDFTKKFTDIDSDSMVKIKIASLPENGVLKLDGNIVKFGDEISAADLSKLVFTPAANWNGNTSFQWNGFDGTAYAAANGVVNISIAPINDAPTVSGASITTNEDTEYAGKLPTATDVDGNPLTHIVVETPKHGKLTLEPNGNYTYTPDSNYNGPDSFSFKVNDGSLDSEVATVSINVTPINDAPIAVNDTATTEEDKSININVLSNDSDVDSDSLTVASATKPEHGTIVVNTDGTITYTPDVNYNGVDSFTYTVSDGKGGTTTATVSVNVTPINDAPSVSDIDKSGLEDTDINFATEDFTSKFTDIDKDSLVKIKVVTLPENGVLKLDDNIVKVGDEISTSDLSKLVFTPGANWNGSTNFEWKGFDGTAYAVANGVVNVSVSPVNDAPTVSHISKVGIEDVEITFSPEDFINKFNDIDGDSMIKVRIVTLPENGTLKLDGKAIEAGEELLEAELSKLTFIPNENWYGNTSFEWNGFDRTVYAIANGIVNITVSAVNDVPTVPDYNRTTAYNQSVSGKIAGNDMDGDNLEYYLKTAPSKGYIEVDSSGAWTYVPNLNYAGTDSFTVEVSDGHGGKAVSTININIRDKATLIGTVTNIITEEVVPYTTIQLSDLSGHIIYTTITDSQGNYIINNVKLGIYSFKVSSASYATQNIEFDVEPVSETNYTVRKDFKVSEGISFALNLNANPSTILGDGKSTSLLTARVIDSHNNPVANVEVTFSATEGSFPNGAVAITDQNGVATIIFKAIKVEGTQSRKVPVTASVDDKAHNLKVSDHIVMVFEPGMINGIVIDNETGLPISNAIVEVSKDFDGDGIDDFYSRVITGADGKYSIAIPKGNTEYKVNVTKPVRVGDTYVDVKFTQNSQAGIITGAGNEEYSSEKTAAGVVLSKQPDGNVLILSDNTMFSIDVLNKSDMSAANGIKASLTNGVFEAEGLEKGKNYTIAINYTFPTGEKLVVGTVDVAVNSDGQISISSALIDPYGTITDALTHNIIDGARVQLYYADTARNRAAGRTPNTLVNLPRVPGFEPADNNNPQMDDINGKYGFMVFPDADYYIVVTKDGYETFTSETIPVEKSIVKRDIQMKGKIIQQLPKTGSPIDFNSLNLIGLIAVALGVGITLKRKKRE